MSGFDVGVVVFACALGAVWILSVWWFVRLERRRPPMSPTGDGGVRADCVACDGLGALPSRSGPVVCPACGGTGAAD